MVGIPNVGGDVLFNVVEFIIHPFAQGMKKGTGVGDDGSLCPGSLVDLRQKVEVGEGGDVVFEVLSQKISFPFCTVMAKFFEPLLDFVCYLTFESVGLDCI